MIAMYSRAVLTIQKSNIYRNNVIQPMTPSLIIRKHPGNIECADSVIEIGGDDDLFRWVPLMQISCISGKPPNIIFLT